MPLGWKPSRLEDMGHTNSTAAARKINPAAYGMEVDVGETVYAIECLGLTKRQATRAVWMALPTGQDFTVNHIMPESGSTFVFVTLGNYSAS